MSIVHRFCMNHQVTFTTSHLYIQTSSATLSKNGTCLVYDVYTKVSSMKDTLTESDGDFYDNIMAVKIVLEKVLNQTCQWVSFAWSTTLVTGVYLRT